MCSRCMTSPGASLHMISMASWSPRKSEPFTVSKACERQSSAGLIAALMPPAAATECERTGWTLLNSATDAPASAAANAARCPARPAPMMRTSCAGMLPAVYLSGLRDDPPIAWTRSSGHAARRGRGERAADLLEGDDAAQALVAVDDHQRAERAQALRAEEVLDRRVVVDAEGLVAVRVEHVGDVQRRLALLHGAVDAGLVQQPEEAARDRVGDREPRPAVAQEELVLGLQDGGIARDPDGLGVHDVGHRHALQALGEAARDDRAGRRLA